MACQLRIGILRAAVSVIALIAASKATKIEAPNLAGLEDIYGRYTPSGDCKRQPQILVEFSGLTFEVAGKIEKVTNPEYAANYGAHDYAGISKWLFPSDDVQRQRAERCATH